MDQLATPTSYVILVDDRDQEIGIAEKLNAHQRGLLHRAFSVFVFRKINDHYELLLQQRNLQKYHSAGLWTNTCCSHPRPGENLQDAAKNRLKEEMGIDVDLTEVGAFKYEAEVGNNLIEHEFDHVLIGFIGTSTIQINHNEVADYRWINLNVLENELNNNPEQFTSWFKQALAIAMASVNDQSYRT